MSHPITTPTGTTVTLEDHDGDLLVILTNPNAPQEFRRTEAGRVIDGTFQPAPFAAFGMRPAVLRAVADLIDAKAVETP